MSVVFCIMEEISFNASCKSGRFAPTVPYYYSSHKDAWKKVREECERRAATLTENGTEIMKKGNAYLRYKTTNGTIYEVRYSIHAVKAGD